MATRQSDMSAALEPTQAAFETKTVPAGSPLPVIAASAVAAFGIHIFVPINHDVAWIMEGAGRLLDGGRFGRDIVDMNPPLAWWLSTIPAELARLTGIGITAALTLFVIAVGLASIGLTAGVLSVSRFDAVLRFRVLSVFAVVGFLGVGADFGQREHLMMFFAMPYVIAAACRLNKDIIPPKFAFAIGLFSAIGFCLKPFFLALPLFIEILIAIRTRSLTRWLRAEFLAIPGVGALYVAAVFVYAPDYLFGNAPDAMSNYWAYNDPFVSVLPAIFATFGISLVAYLLVVGSQRKHTGILTIVLFVASAASALAALCQMKTWSYHLEPVFVFGALAFFAYVPAAEVKAQKFVYRALPVIVLLSACAGSIFQLFDTVQPNGTAANVNRLASVFERFAGPGGYVYAITTLVQDVHPAVIESETRWPAKMGCLYLLPAKFRKNEVAPSHWPKIEDAARRQVRQVVADLERTTPAVILVDYRQTRISGATGDDYLNYFAKDARFRHLWRQYIPQGTAGQFKIFVRRNRVKSGDG